MAKRPASDFFTPASKRAPAPSWATVTGRSGTFFRLTDPAATPSRKVAAFDVARAVTGAFAPVLTLGAQDGTLVKTKKGAQFASGPEDWQFLTAGGREAERAQALHAAGFRLVLFSNQGGVGAALTGKRAATVKGYIAAAARALGAPCDAFVAPGKDACRKPGLGMWHAFLEANGGVDLGASFFVGDAAGRPQDHSDCDQAFAAAAGLRFYLPQQFMEASWPPLLAEGKEEEREAAP